MVLCGSPAWGQFRQGGDSGGASLGETQTQKWKAGLIVVAAGGPCRGIVGYVPVPIDWPEQKVRIAEEDITPGVRVSYDTTGGTVKVMTVRIASLPAGQQARALVTLEIERSELIAPDETDGFVIPDRKKLRPEIRPYLGPSPLIETTNSKIRDAAREAVEGVEPSDAWGTVRAIYDWVRQRVEYKNGPIKGALAALNDRTGDCEELTSLFIALCRVNGIPARTVWVPDHCYPEFYLEDKDGNGHWFPCQAAGTEAFGGISEFRPVLQKGDNFRPPWDRRNAQRYMAEHLTGGGGTPNVSFVRQMVSD